MIAPDDRGFTLGDGLFETVLAEGGVLRHLDQHLDRLASGCAVMGMAPPDRDRVVAALHAALTRSGLGEARAAVRVTLTPGAGGRGLDRPDTLSATLVASAAGAPRLEGPIRLATSTIRRNDTSPTARLKTLSYLDNVLARREARAAGADDALMLNTRGELACAAAANLFWLEGDRLCTPALACGVLAGTVRARILRMASGAGLGGDEVRATPDALRTARAVFISNSLIGVRPVGAIDGVETPAWDGLAALAARVD